MTFSTGGFHGLAYVPEVTFGVTPSTPTMIALRNKGSDLGVNKDSFQSEELRSDRQISDLRHGAVKVSGGFDFELSYGEYDAILEMALFSAWNTNVLKAGTTAKSATFERAFGDITKYGVFTGCMVDSLSLTVPSNGMVTGKVGLIGKNALPISGTPLDATPTASQTNSPFDGFTGEVKEGGTTNAVVTSVSLDLKNSLDPAFVLGSNIAAAITPGRSNLTGTLSAWFDSETMLNKFINETESSLEFTLGNGTTKSYTFLVPRIKYSGGGSVQVSGEGRIALSMPWQALYHTSTGSNIQITRIPGA
jgi:hypothetical protein